MSIYHVKGKDVYHAGFCTYLMLTEYIKSVKLFKWKCRIDVYYKVYLLLWPCELAACGADFCPDFMGDIELERYLKRANIHTKWCAAPHGTHQTIYSAL